MTRYIDAEALKQALIEGGIYPAIVKNTIDRMPTADVVPRAEVAPRCAFAYDGETWEYCVQAPCPNFKTVEEIRAEVAREIFAKLDEALAYAIQSATKALSKERDVLYSGFLGGKNEAYKYTLCFLNQLKQKYGVTDDGT